MKFVLLIFFFQEKFYIPNFWFNFILQHFFTMSLKRNALTERASLYPLSFDNYPINQRTPTCSRQILTSSYSPRNRSVDHSYEGIMSLKGLLMEDKLTLLFIY